MNNTAFDALRPYLSRLIAGLVTMLLTWLMSHGIDLGTDAAGGLTEAGTALAIGGFTIIYGLIHRTLDKKLNPGDAASSHIAKSDVTKADDLKRMEQSTQEFEKRHGKAPPNRLEDIPQSKR